MPFDRTDSQGAIAIDLACLQCGYNLRGLDPAGRCPECGVGIALSTRGDLLRFANPDWLRRVKLGADLMLATILLSLVLGFGVGCLNAVFASATARILAVLVALAAGGCRLAAVYLITAQEPRISLTEREITWRRALRALAVIAFVATIVLAAEIVQHIPVLFQLGSVVFALATPFITFGYFAYAETFAVRIPSPKLARSSRIVKWGLSAIQVLQAVVAIVALLIFGSATVGVPGGPITVGRVTTPATTTAPAIVSPPTPTATAPAPVPAPMPGVPPAVRPYIPAFAALGCAYGVASLIFSIWGIVLLA
ncbi:MAG: hypothetical protein JSU68_02515, partial [Phycisphaerales bacterium]